MCVQVSADVEVARTGLALYIVYGRVEVWEGVSGAGIGSGANVQVGAGAEPVRRKPQMRQDYRGSGEENPI